MDREGYDMKNTVLRVLASLTAVCLTVSMFAACGKSSKEPADSLIASETFVNATVPEMDEDDLDKIIEDILDGEWDGDISSLTEEQANDLIAALKQKGYSAAVKDGRLVYYSYTPTADTSEIAEVVQEVRGDSSWDGKYRSLSSEEKAQVQEKLKARGYDVEPGKNGFTFVNEADRKAQTTRSSYNRLPTKEQLSAVLNDTLGVDGFVKWDGNFSSLTEEQQKNMLDQLNDYGFDVDLNDKGQLYVVHAPENTMVYDSAYSAAVIDGTTAPTTTVETTTKAGETTENVTGTTAAKEEEKLPIEKEQLATFGGASSSFRKVIATKDGGYLALGWFNYAVGDYADTDTGWKEMRSSLVKYDKNGKFAWKICFGSKKTEQGIWLQDVAQLKDGSYVAVGYTDAKDLPERTDKTSFDLDGILFRVSSSGELIWRKLMYGTQNEMYYSVAATPDGGFVTGARSDSSDGAFADLTPGVYKAILQKMDADGNVVWTDALNSGALAAIIPGIAVTDEGAIYAAYYAAGGTTLQMDMAQLAGYGGGDSIVIKYNANGEMLTHRAIAGSGTDQIQCIALAPDGGVIVGGSFTKNVREDSVFAGKENQGRSDAFLVRLDARLNVQWVKTFGGDQIDTFTGVAAVKGGFVACVSTMSSNDAFSFLGNGKYDAFVMTVTENGTAVEKYAMGSSNDDEAMAVAAADGRHAAVVGMTFGANNHFIDTDPAGSNSKSISYIERLKIG